MIDESKYLIIHTRKLRTYKYEVTSFSAMSALAIFLALVDELLKHLQCCDKLLDDNTIFSNSE